MMDKVTTAKLNEAELHARAQERAMLQERADFERQAAENTVALSTKPPQGHKPVSTNAHTDTDVHQPDAQTKPTKPATGTIPPKPPDLKQSKEVVLALVDEDHQAAVDFAHDDLQDDHEVVRAVMEKD